MSFPASFSSKPPYYAVIFTSTRRSSPSSISSQSYSETASRMLELAAQQPGYLGIESLDSSEPASSSPALDPTTLPDSTQTKDEGGQIAREQEESLIRSVAVSYWRTEEDVKGWKRELEHLRAQRKGREEWYDTFELKVAKVERAYGFRRGGKP